MQIYAFDLQRKLIPAREAVPDTEYRCTSCDRLVRARETSPLYFYHPHSIFCPSPGKSVKYLHIQYALQTMLGAGNILLEHPLPQIRRTASVVWPAEHLLFEIVLSSLSAAGVASRNRAYQQLGYRIVWILHDHFFNHTRFSEAELFLRPFPHYFTNINSFGKGIFYDQCATIWRNRRIHSTPRHPLSFITPCPLPIDLLPIDAVSSRRTWPLCFADDLFLQSIENSSSPLRIRDYLLEGLSRGYRSLFQLVLEKQVR